MKSKNKNTQMRAQAASVSVSQHSEVQEKKTLQKTKCTTCFVQVAAEGVAAAVPCIIRAVILHP